MQVCWSLTSHLARELGRRLSDRRGCIFYALDVILKNIATKQDFVCRMNIVSTIVYLVPHLATWLAVGTSSVAITSWVLAHRRKSGTRITAILAILGALTLLLILAKSRINGSNP